MIIRLSGGLGNQMFQYAFGRALATTRNEKLYIDDFSFKRDPQRVYALEPYLIKCEKLSKAKKIWFNCIFYANRKLSFISRGKTTLGLYYEKKEFEYLPIYQKNASYFEGCWQNVHYFEDNKDEIRQELTYQGELSKKEQKALNKICAMNTVAVHVRHGDYLKPTNQEMYVVQKKEYYENAIAYIRNRIPEAVFCFFSDDLEWCQKEFGDLENVYFPDLPVERSAQVDLYLMQNCSHFIIANSSFSWWASFLGKKEHSIQIAPKRWYQDTDVNEKVTAALLGDMIIID